VADRSAQPGQLSHQRHVVRDVDAWYQAFAVEPGNALYLTPEERVNIW
jgi:putative endopeptidase